MEKNKRQTKLFILSIAVVLCGMCTAIVLSIAITTHDDIKTHAIVSEILNQIPIEKCYLEKLPKYDDLNIYLDMPVIEDEEVNDYMLQLTDGVAFEELTDEIVKQILNVDTVEEFYNYAYEKAVERKKVKQILDARRALIQELHSRTSYVLDKDEIAQYAVEIVHLYEMYAASSGLSLDEYITENFSSREAFFSMCYGEAKQKIENYLLIGAICSAENVVVEMDDSKENSDFTDFSYQQLENAFYALFIYADPDY